MENTEFDNGKDIDAFEKKRKRRSIAEMINSPEANLTEAQKRHNIICTIAGILATVGMIGWLVWVITTVNNGTKEEPEDDTNEYTWNFDSHYDGSPLINIEK